MEGKVKDFQCTDQLKSDKKKVEKILRKVRKFKDKNNRITFTLESTNSKESSRVEMTDKFVHPEDCLNNDSYKRLQLLTRTQAQISFVKGDGKLWESHPEVKLSSIKSLSDGIIQIIEMCKLNPPSKEREIILAATRCISLLFKQCKNKYNYSVTSAQLDFFIHYLLDLLCKNYVNSETLIERYEFVCEILLILDSNEIFHFTLGSLMGAVKSSLNRINRHISKSKDNGILDMNEIDILFKYYTLMEQVIQNIPEIEEDEVVKLRSIERTAATAIPYPLVSFNAGKLARLAASRTEKCVKKFLAGRSGSGNRSRKQEIINSLLAL